MIKAHRTMFMYGQIKHGRWSIRGVIKFLAELLIRHQTYHFSIDLSVLMCKSALKIGYSWHFAKTLLSTQISLGNNFSFKDNEKSILFGV